MNQPTTNFQQLYYRLLKLELRRTLNLLKPHIPEKTFEQLEAYLGAGEFGIVAETLIERGAHADTAASEEARVQLDILAEVMGIDIDS